MQFNQFTKPFSDACSVTDKNVDSCPAVGYNDKIYFDKKEII